MANYWKTLTQPISTPFIIARGNGTNYTDGQIFQLFGSNRGCWHLGLTAAHLAVGGPEHASNTYLNMSSVPIELCNWGGLTQTQDGRYLTYSGVEISSDQIQEYPNKFRGYQFYQKYTAAQLSSLQALLSYLCDKYGVSKTWIGMEMFDVSKRALCGVPGIWTHCSFRPSAEKQDCHPQPELLQMLQSIP